MRVELTVTTGPHAGRVIAFDRRDTFLVGRGTDAHFRLSADDPYFSRRRFLIEVNPPRAKLTDLNSRNGVYVNGVRVTAPTELFDGDEVKAGDTVFRVRVPRPDPDHPTLDRPPAGPPPILVTEIESTPEVVPGYRLGAKLGRGGMGVVYRAERISDGRKVAVKTIKPAAGADGKDARRFVREAKLLGKLSHPRVVEFVEAGQAGGLLFIVMELVDGTDAGKLVRTRGPLPVRSAVRVACEMHDGPGRTPTTFRKESLGQMIALITDAPVPVRDRRAEVPAGLAAAVHKALSR